MRKAGYGLPGLLLSAAVVLFSGGNASGQGWSGPEIIDGGQDYQEMPQVAMDKSGHAVAVYNEQTFMGAIRVYANTWDGSSWAGAGLIDAGYDSWRPAVAMDASGNAIAAFEQYTGSDYHVYANHWNGTAWGSAMGIAPGLSPETVSPAVTMDGSGRAIAVYQTNETYNRIYASYWDGSAWIQRAIISAIISHPADSPNVAMDESGHAIAVFRQYGTPNRIYANHWNGVGWNDLTTIDMGWGYNALAPSVAMDGSGNAVAIFLHNDGADNRPCANWWNGSSWSGATTIDAGPGDSATDLEVALNGKGEAVAVFVQDDGTKNRVWATLWDGSSWAGATTIDSGAWTDAENAAVAIDGFGRAMAAFTEFSETGSFTGPRKMYAAVYDGSAWSAPVRIDREVDADSSGNPQVAMDPSGHAIAVFEQADGSDRRVYANRYTPPARPSSTWNYDYNGDGTSDIAIFRDSAGLWAIRGLSRVYFGRSDDLPSPGDYDGDGTTEIAVFRRSSGLWAVRDGVRAYFGASPDTPLPRDYNGDGTSQIAIFRPASGLWAIRGTTRAYFGAAGDTPLPGDYQGYGAADIGIFREATGLWAARGLSRVYFGRSGDLPVPAQYASAPGFQPAIFRSSTGLWAVISGIRNYFGTSGDTPVPADYDGDGIARIGVFRPTTGLWAIQGLSRVYFGSSGDVPVTR